MSIVAWREDLAQDFRGAASDLPVRPSGREWCRALLRTTPTVRYLAVLLFRLSQIVGARLPPAGAFVKQLNHVITGTDIAFEAQIGGGLLLYHPTGVVA